MRLHRPVELVGITSNASNLADASDMAEQSFPAPGRILYSLINLRFLLVGLVRDLVRIVLTGLSFLSLHCANIGFGVAAGEQNGCGEQHSQRNFRHRSSSTRLAAIHHPAWLWALLLVQRPIEGWGRDLSCPVRTNSVVRPRMPVSRPVAWMSWISEEARRVGRRPAEVWLARKFYGFFRKDERSGR